MARSVCFAGACESVIRSSFFQADGRRALAVASGADEFHRCDNREESGCNPDAAVEIWTSHEAARATRVLYEPKYLE